jgi:subfamily B ATP-binding cassette protein MsbA
LDAVITFLSKLWGFVRPYRTRFFLGLLCGAGYGIANGLMVATIQNVLELVFNRHITLHSQLAKAPASLQPAAHWLMAHVPDFHAPADGDLLGWALVIGAIPGIMLLRNSLQYLSIYLTNWSSVHAIADIRTKLFAHLQGLSLGFFNQAKTGDLMARINSDTQALHVVVNNSLASIVRDPVTLICLVGYNLIMQPTLTLVSAIVFPVCIVPIVIYGRKVRKSARAVQTHNAELTNLMHEAFTGSRVIKAYNLEETVTAQFVATTRKYVSQIMRVIRSGEIPGQFTEFFAAAGIALVFYYIVCLPAAARPSLASLTSFILTMVLIYPSVKQLTRLQNQLQQARAASERVFELLATQNTIPEPVAPKMLHADKADIVFENLDFSFGDKPVLRNINLQVKAGQMIALVGASGSGKTTLANLLLRFYDPDRGAIKIGGVDLREVRTRDLRNQIAVVAQENILFNDTIRRNIELGRLGAKDEEIIAAARHAYAYDFIMQRPEGFDAVIGEKGVSLSGGQRQRLAIARAVLKDAPVLLLDEATSALDTESERAVQAALDELMKGRTTICIAHRLSTILHADMIVVLDHGKIVETGRHEELVKRGGVYQKLYELQFAS